MGQRKFLEEEEIKEVARLVVVVQVHQVHHHQVVEALHQVGVVRVWVVRVWYGSGTGVVTGAVRVWYGCGTGVVRVGGCAPTKRAAAR